MSEFLSGFYHHLRDDSDEIYILDEPLVYLSDSLGLIVVPKGFHTDLASVPRVPIFYELFGDRAHREAVIHDYLYRRDAAQFIWFNKDLKEEVTFSQANWAFKEAMECRGKSFWVQWGMYTGVVLGGYFSFHKRYVADTF